MRGREEPSGRVASLVSRERPYARVCERSRSAQVADLYVSAIGARASHTAHAPRAEQAPA